MNLVIWILCFGASFFSIAGMLLVKYNKDICHEEPEPEYMAKYRPTLTLEEVEYFESVNWR